MIHGGMGREERMKAQESFRHDPEVQVLLATDAAGEGINLQRAHLMVNYDLPWNPNRIEQRFGRIHRIGQTEVCHLWNLVADETREGDVYRRLLEKLEQARQALGGQVFDVLGKLQFEGKALRDLLIEAIRYGDQPEVRARLTTVLDQALDREQLRCLLEERALAHDAMDASRVYQVREEMERAEARRLQPHYIESFFHEAFRRLGGTEKQREPRRYEVTYVPGPLRARDRLIGIGEPVLPRYERIAFEKALVAPPGQPPAAFVCPGHPLLDVVIDLTLERHRDLLRRGAVLVDELDPGTQPRVLFYLEHAIQDAGLTRSGERRVISKRMLYVELDAAGAARHPHYAPYLDYRPLCETEPGVDAILERPECAWIAGSAGFQPASLEHQVVAHAVAHVVPEHLAEVRDARVALIARTEAAVKDRLIKEITYWDHRAEQLKLQEQAGKPNARLNSGEARKRADVLQARLEKRLADLKLEAQISPLPPVVLGGLLVVPIGLLELMAGKQGAPVEAGTQAVPAIPVDTQAAAARARAVVMEVERSLGFDPVDREFEQLGYDIESRVPGTGKLRFIEVKGRVAGAESITVTKNEILYSLNKPDDYILAIVEFLSENAHRVGYLRQPFRREPDFGVTSVNYDFAGLLAGRRRQHKRRAPMSYSDGELERLLVDVESDLAERKESLKGDAPTAVREAVCAFANDLPDYRRPGVVFVGARDDGSPSGLAVTDELLRQLWYDDRIEILSPGGPYGEVTPENFGTPGLKDYRNPNLAEAMRVLGYVQKFGAGIVAARGALQRNGNPPLEFQVDQHYVLATVRPAP